MVYLNIIKSIRILLDALDMSTAAAAPEDMDNTWRTQLANLKLRLSPLVGMESSLASRLSGGGGVAMNGGKGGVFVRRGWQTTLKSDQVDNTRSPISRQHGKASLSGALAVEDPIARMLEASKVSSWCLYLCIHSCAVYYRRTSRSYGSIPRCLPRSRNDVYGWMIALNCMPHSYCHRVCV